MSESPAKSLPTDIYAVLVRKKPLRAKQMMPACGWVASATGMISGQ
jgi:hypothetical protein